MNKSELRQKYQKYKRQMAHRISNEGAIIEALPLKLDVVRVTTLSRIDAPENGGIEVECDNYGDALGLIERFSELAPIPMAHISAERTPTFITSSFLPLCRVPMRWYSEGDGVIREVYPILVQLIPSDDPLRPRVVLEWFAELRHELIVNVRATIKNHPVVWRGGNNGVRGVWDKRRGDTPFGGYLKRDWAWANAPEAPHQRVTNTRQAQPPFVTLWWDDTFRDFAVFLTRSEEGQPDAKTKA